MSEPDPDPDPNPNPNPTCSGWFTGEITTDEIRHILSRSRSPTNINARATICTSNPSRTIYSTSPTENYAIRELLLPSPPELSATFVEEILASVNMPTQGPCQPSTSSEQLDTVTDLYTDNEDKNGKQSEIEEPISVSSSTSTSISPNCDNASISDYENISICSHDTTRFDDEDILNVGDKPPNEIFVNDGHTEYKVDPRVIYISDSDTDNKGSSTNNQQDRDSPDCVIISWSNEATDCAKTHQSNRNNSNRASSSQSNTGVIVIPECAENDISVISIADSNDSFEMKAEEWINLESESQENVEMQDKRKIDVSHIEELSDTTDEEQTVLSSGGECSTNDDSNDSQMDVSNLEELSSDVIADILDSTEECLLESVEKENMSKRALEFRKPKTLPLQPKLPDYSNIQSPVGIYINSSRAPLKKNAPKLTLKESAIPIGPSQSTISDSNKNKSDANIPVHIYRPAKYNVMTNKLNDKLPDSIKKHMPQMPQVIKHLGHLDRKPYRRSSIEKKLSKIDETISEPNLDSSSASTSQDISILSKKTGYKK